MPSKKTDFIPERYLAINASENIQYLPEIIFTVDTEIIHV